MHEEPGLEDAEVGEEALPKEADEEGGGVEAPGGPVEDDDEAWLRKIEEEEDLEIRHLTLVEPLENRSCQHCPSGILDTSTASSLRPGWRTDFHPINEMA